MQMCSVSSKCCPGNCVSGLRRSGAPLIPKCSQPLSDTVYSWLPMLQATCPDGENSSERAALSAEPDAVRPRYESVCVSQLLDWPWSQQVRLYAQNRRLPSWDDWKLQCSGSVRSGSSRCLSFSDDSNDGFSDVPFGTEPSGQGCNGDSFANAAAPSQHVSPPKAIRDLEHSLMTFHRRPSSM